MSKNVKGTVYLIHFDDKLCHAQHYIGWAKNVDARCAHHKNGTGARLMAAVSDLGLPWKVVRIWENQDRNFERKLKNRKNAKLLCPVCSGNAAWNRAKGE